MLFLFFCPASVYQQSFLGGEQTAASTTSTDAEEQHRDQQRKPIRLATFEFDFKKQRSNRQDSPSAQATRTSARAEWKLIDHYDVLPIETTDSHKRSSQEQDRDEVDFTNGNHSEKDESVFLNSDCLQDIHNLSRSMHDLINNLNENTTPRRRLTSSRSATSSLNSIPENVNSLLHIDNSRLTTAMACNYHSSSSIRCDEKIIEKVPVTPKSYHQGDKKNGNMVKEQPKYFNLHCETPKSSTKCANSSRQRCGRKSLYDTDSGKTKFDSDDFRNSNVSATVVSTSSESSLTGGSSNGGNDIETSDSFVNIQFARLVRGQKSSSTQSMESTDSFENVNFRYSNDTNDNSRLLSDRPSQIPTKIAIHSGNHRDRKSTTRALQTRIAALNLTSKSPKLDNQLERKTCNNTKIQEMNKCAKNEPVKLRHERYINRKSQIEYRNATRGKRYSCFSPCVKKSPEEAAGDNKVVTRKFNSTDELRDTAERQKPAAAARSKRFSLYYTPQPLRKTYVESEAKAGRIVCKSVSRVSKSTEAGKTSRDEEGAERVEKMIEKDRRSVVDTSTVASRSKSSRQNVHVRANVMNASLIAARTK